MPDVAVRPGVVFKAALLAKTDLTTELVKEFTELQGIVGGLYAKVQELDPELAAGHGRSYWRCDLRSVQAGVDGRRSSAHAGRSRTCDRRQSRQHRRNVRAGADSSGSKDPFALRRAANGIVKIIAEHKLPLSLAKLFADARAEYIGSEAEQRFDKKLNFEEAVRDFMRERLEFYLREVHGYRVRRGECRARRRAAMMWWMRWLVPKP